MANNTSLICLVRLEVQSHEQYGVRTYYTPLHSLLRQCEKLMKYSCANERDTLARQSHHDITKFSLRECIKLYSIQTLYVRSQLYNNYKVMEIPTLLWKLCASNLVHEIVLDDVQPSSGYTHT